MFVPKSRYFYFIASNYLKMKKVLPQVYLDINIGQKPAGRLTIELFEDQVPKTTENFRQLVAEQKYKHSTFDRIVPGMMIQGGSIEKPGTLFILGKESIYGKRFADENFNVSHNKAGLLSMVNNGPDSNGSAFFITLQPTEWLDRKNVVFGKVVDGFDVLAQMEDQGDSQEKAKNKVEISGCGEVKKEQ